eukprot:9738009-Alexandrium_andersonii.AAC.1
MFARAANTSSRSTSLARRPHAVSSCLGGPPPRIRNPWSRKSFLAMAWVRTVGLRTPAAQRTTGATAADHKAEARDNREIPSED